MPHGLLEELSLCRLDPREPGTSLRALPSAGLAGFLRTAKTSEEGIANVVQEVLDTLDWDVGTLWIPARGVHVYRCDQIQIRTRARFLSVATTWLQLPRVLRLQASLLSRVTSDGVLAWIEDLGATPDPTRPWLRDKELYSAVEIPVALPGDQVGVLELLSMEHRARDEEKVRLLSRVAADLSTWLRQRDATTSTSAP